MNEIAKIEKLLRHVDKVQENCTLLGKKLIEAGETDFGRKLIANGRIHDNSKFYGTEWDSFEPESAPKDETEKLKLDLAITQHNRTNRHHPEFWGGVKHMPRIYVAELACDWCARASEFGTSVHDWIKESGTKRYGFTKNTKFYKELNFFLGLILEQPFKN